MRLKLQEFFLDSNIKGISFDSRKIKPGDAFFAIRGEDFDGNDYIDNVLERGVSVVFTDNPSKQRDRVIYIEDARMGLALAAGMLYQKKPENIVAVTGTNGKSSVVSYVHQILAFLRKTSASMGTLGVESTQKLPKEIVSPDRQSILTTVDPINFRKILHALAESGVQNVAFEASSHGLYQRRLGDIKIKTAAFVSFSQEHLEYHQTMESYLHAKLILFTENLLHGGEAVINSEIMFFDFIKKFLVEKQIKYSSVGKNGDLLIKKCKSSIEGQKIACEFMNKKYEFNTDIIGSFQATNILIAAKLVYNLGIDFDTIINILPNLKAVRGRLQRITERDDEFQVFVDYAHTPDALKRSLLELQEIKNKTGKLYVVFGCGGDRDTMKRPMMGKIASDIADYVIITDDNPRTEDPRKIRSEIAEGAIDAEEVEDRKSAIVGTIARLKRDDILLIAGKGHEDYQIIGHEITKFSDIEVACNALQKFVAD